MGSGELLPTWPISSWALKKEVSFRVLGEGLLNSYSALEKANFGIKDRLVGREKVVSVFLLTRASWNCCASRSPYSCQGISNPTSKQETSLQSLWNLVTPTHFASFRSNILTHYLLVLSEFLFLIILFLFLILAIYQSPTMHHALM